MRTEHYMMIGLFLLSGIRQADAQIQRSDHLESPVAFQTPNVAEMTRYVDRPVTYFNGSVGISVPLCEVSAGGITIPISLNYSSTGFRPSQEASWVGLGWSLSLNACISRSIKCVDDFLEFYTRKEHSEFEHGYYGSAGLPTEDDSNYLVKHVLQSGDAFTATAEYADELITDTQPDIFYYSLWSGGDKFVITNDDKAVQPQATFMDKAAGYLIRIKVDKPEGQEKSRHYFELVANDGTVYEFRQREITWIYAGSGSANGHIPIKDYDGRQCNDRYASSWFLTQVTTPLNKKITFNYSAEDYNAVTVESCLKYNLLSTDYPVETKDFIWNLTDTDGFPIWDKDAVYSWSIAKVRTARLSSIVWDEGRILLKSSTREDMYPAPGYEVIPQKLDTIEVYNSLGKIVHQYKLNYGYFGTGQGNEYDSYLYKRLRLDSVTDLLAENYTFAFEYDENTAFPVKYTKSTDYWGYYNGIDYGDRYYCQVFDPTLNRQKLYSGASKESSLECTRLGVLTAVTYPTGGKEAFTYGLNSYPWPEYIQDGGQEIASYGILGSIPDRDNHFSFRVGQKAIMQLTGTLYSKSQPFYYDGPNTLLTIEKDGKFFDTVKSSEISTTITGTVSKTLSKQLEPGEYELIIHKFDNSDCGSSWTIKLLDPSPVHYTREDKLKSGAGLRIERIDGGGKTREFSYSDGKLLIDPVLYQTKQVTGYVTTVTNADPAHYETEVSRRIENLLIQFSESAAPLSSLSKGYDLGYKTVTETIDGITTTYQYNDIVKEQRVSPNPYLQTQPVFTNGQLIGKTVTENGKTVYSENISYGSRSSNFIPSREYSYVRGFTNLYNLKFQWYFPSYKTTVADGVTTVESYTYDENYLLPISTNRSVSGQPSTGTGIKYTFNSVDTVHTGMVSRNIIAPVRELSYTGGRLTGGRRSDYRYDASAGTYLPDRSSDVRLNAADPDSDASYVERISYDRYDASGNPLQVTIDGIPTSYIWGYRGQYPIAEITNCTYGELTSVIQSGKLDEICGKAEPSDADWEYIDRLRDRECSLLTRYTYIPLVGISSRTDPNGLTTYYSYDDSGRLCEEYIKIDGVKQVLKRYIYNFVGTGL